MASIAASILENSEDSRSVSSAKHLLMKRRGYSEKQAFRALVALADEKQIPLEQAARATISTLGDI
jgi:AmiR/NasT family two-component response regulator